MKKILCLAAALLLLLSGCGSKTALPPVRTGTHEIQTVSLDVFPDLPDAYADADLVASVKIGEWLGEDTDIGCTFYMADVIHTYKGEAVDEILLVQDGTSAATVHNYPLFTAGNRLLLFLYRMDDEELGPIYWIRGSFTSVCDIVKLKKNYFVLPREANFGNSVENCLNWMSTDGMSNVMSELIKRADPLLADHRYLFAFDEADLAKYMATLPDHIDWDENVETLPAELLFPHTAEEADETAGSEEPSENP
ncbi:MAG: hypothetical protein J6Q17_00450 [Clostridia bacterium]|nr:hypothetical protein [Clostridia bacterium]